MEETGEDDAAAAEVQAGKEEIREVKGDEEPHYFVRILGERSQEVGDHEDRGRCEGVATSENRSVEEQGKEELEKERDTKDVSVGKNKI